MSNIRSSIFINTHKNLKKYLKEGYYNIDSDGFWGQNYG